MGIDDWKEVVGNGVTEDHRRAFNRTWLGSLLGQTLLMMGMVVAYGGTLVAIRNYFPEASDELRALTGDIVFYVVALVPLFVILIFSIIPMAFRAWRLRRLKARAFDWDKDRAGIFRLHPYSSSDGVEFTRTDGADVRALSWLRETDRSLLYLSGASGSGKSSLVQASLLPALLDAGWRTALVRVDDDPVDRIRQAILSLPDVLEGRNAADLPLVELLEVVSDQLMQAGGKPLLLVVDQFEEFLILNDAADRQPLLDVLHHVEERPLRGVRLLLVFRSDYRELLFKLNMPRFIPNDSAFELAPFTRQEGEAFLVRGGLNGAPSAMDALFRGLDRIEGLRGVYRPITLNMVGLVLKRMYNRMDEDPSRLIERYLRDAIANGLSRDFARSVLGTMITTEGTKVPRRIETMAATTGLDAWQIKATLSEMESEGLVRSLDAARERWEISHDFLARQVGLLLGRLKRPRLERFALPALALTAVSWAAVVLVGFLVIWPDVREKRALDQLAQMGFARSAESGRHHLILTRPASLDQAKFAQFPRLVAALSEPVVSLDLTFAKGITDLGPLKGMPLTSLNLRDTDGITDLGPLKGMPLTSLDLGFANGMTDLGPLKGMPLTSLDLSNADGITDLGPLKGMPLTSLDLGGADGITDLGPLKGMPLTSLDLGFTNGITDLGPLKGMPLTSLNLRYADRITDLGPLKGMPLTSLDLNNADGITDLGPLKGMPLTSLNLGFADGITDLGPLKGVADLFIFGASPTLLATMK